VLAQALAQAAAVAVVLGGGLAVPQFGGTSPAIIC